MPSTFAQSCANSAGPQTAATFGSASLSGSFVNWSNPAYAQSSDGNYATSGLTLGILSTAYSNYLTIQGFNFVIPSSATICKIIVEVEHSSAGLGIGAYVADQSVRLLRGGVLDGTDLASGTPWPGADVTAQYGNAAGTYLWGTSWLPADINNTNFGVAISAKIGTGLASLTLTPKINQVRMTVVYDMSILGIGLRRFSVTHDSNGNTISWSIDDTPPGVLTIQRSVDSKTWSDLANVDPSQTTYLDQTALNETTYYRIRTISADGISHYSNIALANNNDNQNCNTKKGNNNTNCWPNPFTGSIHISSTQSLQRITMTDTQGHTLSNIQSDAHSYQLATGSLRPGIYFLRTGGGESFRMIKLRQ